jgi:hypothetical protein
MGKKFKRHNREGTAVRPHHSICQVCSHESCTIKLSRSNDTRYSLYGGPTDHKKAGTGSFINAMQM